ncbi:hypothetical protein ACWCQ0_25510 [Streptomyces massasporeus]|uniref:hypothetical protein n=1 Tax=Streptomyces massasporeus TaxID=67324 RepID=UPI0033DDB901
MSTVPERQVFTERRVVAEWAVVGKLPGTAMGFSVLDGSLTEESATVLLRASTTASPESDRPGTPEALPWRTFRSGIGSSPEAFAARIDMGRCSGTDATGRPIFPSLLLTVDWASASAAGLTWTSFDRAAAQAPTVYGRTAFAAAPSPALSLPVPVTPAEELADCVDRIGFDWAAGVAALLLDGRRLAITLRADLAPPSVEERVLILDAVCSLLPYGCRTWLSAATWAGQTDHDLRLVFARRARGDQLEAALHGAPAAEPTGQARGYLQELRRLRAEKGSTAPLVAHLASLTAPLARHSQSQALTGLQEINLLAAVLDSVRSNLGDPVQVSRVLDMCGALGIDAAEHGELVTFLAHRAVRGYSAEEEAASKETLLRHWQLADVPSLVADLGRQRQRLADAKMDTQRWLRLAHGAENPVPGLFERLLHSVLAYEPDGSLPALHWYEWKADLLLAAQAEFDADTAAADPVLSASPEVGVAWLRRALGTGRPDMTAVTRLVRHNEARTGVTGRGSWARCLGALVGSLPVNAVDSADVDAFLAADSAAWLTGLRMSGFCGTTTALELLWHRLWEVASTAHGEADPVPWELREQLDQLVPAGPGASPGAADAARADLLLVRDGEMRRLRAVVTDRESYASTLNTALPDVDPDTHTRVIQALLGQRPDGASWDVIERLVALRASLRHHVLEALAERLARPDGVDWLAPELDRIPGAIRDLSNRPGLEWLPAVTEIRALVRGDSPAEALGAAMRRCCPEGDPPDWLLAEVAPWLAYGFPRVDDLAEAFDRGVAGGGVPRLYRAIGSGRLGGQLRDSVLVHSTSEAERWRRVADTVREGPATSGDAAQRSWSQQPPQPQQPPQSHQPQPPPSQQGYPPSHAQQGHRQQPDQGRYGESAPRNPPKPQSLPDAAAVYPALGTQGETRTTLPSDPQGRKRRAKEPKAPKSGWFGRQKRQP